MTSINPASFNSPYFKWKDPFLTIRITDSASPQEPPVLEKSTSIDDDDPRWQQRNLRWRVKLGELLVKDYLAIELGQQKKGKKYILARFPTNYEFYVHKRAQAPDKKPHYDSYLAGGGHMFRSPYEFVFHAAWLIAGAVPGECSCIYCDRTNPGQTQRTRSIASNRILVAKQLRGFKDSGVNVRRKRNALNRRAFLKVRPQQGTSFDMDEDEEDGDEEANSNSSPSVGIAERLIDEETDMEE